MTTSRDMQTNKTIDSSRKPVVFYDGQCPLCSREIMHYKKLDCANSIDWIDLHALTTDLELYGLDKNAAMARLHVMDTTGNWQTGAWAFAEMWNKLPYYRSLAWILRKCRLLPLTDKAYNLFAAWRLRRPCKTASCQKTNDGQGSSAPQGR